MRRTLPAWCPSRLAASPCRSALPYQPMHHFTGHNRAGRSRAMTRATSVTIYGIKACDTMKKARAWLDDHGVAYQFHDYKAAGVEHGRLEGWARAVGWETLLNRAGTTFRKLL